MQGFGEAHRETDGGPTSTRQRGQSIVGLIQHKTQSLGHSSHVKSDLSRRRDTTTAERTTISSLPPVQSHKELAGGGSNHPTSNATAETREGRCDESQSLVGTICNSKTTTEAFEHSPRVVGSPETGPFSLRAQDGLKAVLNTSEKGSDHEDTQDNTGEGEEEEERVEGLFGQESPATTSPSPQRPHMTNGVGLPAVNISSGGVPIVPGVNSLIIPGETVQGRHCVQRASSAPTDTADAGDKRLESAKSCGELLLLSVDEGETRGAKRKCKTGGEEGKEGGAVGREDERRNEGEEGEGSAVKTLAVPWVQELRDKRKMKVSVLITVSSVVHTYSIYSTTSETKSTEVQTLGKLRMRDTAN